MKETQESTQKERRRTRLASKPKSALNMEQQATTLLMKKCGLLQEKEALNQAKEEEFRAKFVQPMEDNMVTNYRDTFGLQVVEGTDCLGAMAIHARRGMPAVCCPSGHVLYACLGQPSCFGSLPWGLLRCARRSRGVCVHLFL